MSKKIIVWDLFGGSQNSVYHALKYFKEFEVYTFDNNPKVQHDKQYVVDLSQGFLWFKDFVEKNNIPKPDIIAASPLCQSFSVLMNAGEKGERLAWKLDKEKDIYVIRDLEEIEQLIQSNNFLKQNKAELIRERAVLGEKLLNFTINCIGFYNPPGWYIENPQTSLMWDFIKKNWLGSFYGFICTTEYNSYDLSFSAKPTTFLASSWLHLKRYGIRGNTNRKVGDRLVGTSNNETGTRVKIPALLLIDIFHQFLRRVEMRRLTKEKENVW